MTKSGKINRTGLLRLAEQLINLEEVTLIVDTDITKADIVDFLNSCKHLQRLHLLVLQRDQFKRLDTEIDNIFTVTSFSDGHWGEVTIERRDED